MRLFVEEASLSEDINMEKANQEAQKAKVKIKGVTNQVELQKAEAALKTALMKLKIAQGRQRRR